MNKFGRSKNRNLWNIPAGVSGKSPSARWGHTSTFVKKKKLANFESVLYVFGGWSGDLVNDMFMFNLNEQRWTEIVFGKRGRVPSRRSGHSMCNIDRSEKNKLLLIGGDEKNYMKDLWLFDYEKESWEIKRVGSDHKVYLKDDLLVNEKFIERVDTVDKTDVLIKREPKAKKEQSVETPKKKIVSKEEPHDFYFGKKSAEVKDIGFGGKTKEVMINKNIKAREKSVFPITRTRHTCTYFAEKHVIIMFGGGRRINGENKVLDDLWILDLKKWKWKKPKTIGRIDPVWGHSASRVGKYVFFFGGCLYKQMKNDLIRFNTETNEFDKIQLYSSTLPSCRAAHSTVPYGKNLIILWGGDNSCFLEEMVVINTEVFVCKTVAFKKPNARCAHTANVVNNMMYVLGGGRDQSARFKELYACNLDYLVFVCNIKDRITRRKLEIEKIKQTYNLKVQSDEEDIKEDLTENTETKISPLSPIGGFDMFQRVRSSKTDETKDGFAELKSKYLDNFPDDGFLPLTNNVEVFKDNSTEKKRSHKKRRKRHFEKDRSPTLVRNYQQSSNKNKRRDQLPIALWLSSLGLKKYFRMFLANEIDMKSLMYLKDDDLFKMGIKKLGPRKKILYEIQEMSEFKRKTSPLGANKARNMNNFESYKIVTNLQKDFKDLKDTVKKLSILIESRIPTRQPYNQNQHYNQPQHQNPYYYYPQQQPQYFNDQQYNNNYNYNQANFPQNYQQGNTNGSYYFNNNGNNQSKKRGSGKRRKSKSKIKKKISHSGNNEENGQ